VRTPGNDHPSVATTCDNMGSVYDCQGDYVKALEYHGKALRIRLKVLGDARGTAQETPALRCCVVLCRGLFIICKSHLMQSVVSDTHGVSSTGGAAETNGLTP